MKYVLQLAGAVLILYLLILLLRGDRKKKPSSAARDAPLEEIKRDPVCGTYLPESQAITLKRGDRILYFCSRECLDRYTREE